MTRWERWGPVPESLDEHAEQKAGEWWGRTSLDDYIDLGEILSED